MLGAEGAFTPEELAVMDQIDPVDLEAALAWMLGEGPDPWPERFLRTLLELKTTSSRCRSASPR